MTIEEAQITVDQWIKEFGVKYFSELTNMAILTEEVGEVARIISRRYGDQSFKESDKEHPYGHERFECVAAIILSINNPKCNFGKITYPFLSFLSSSGQTTVTS